MKNILLALATFLTIFTLSFQTAYAQVDGWSPRDPETIAKTLDPAEALPTNKDPEARIVEIGIGDCSTCYNHRYEGEIKQKTNSPPSQTGNNSTSNTGAQ